MSNTVAPPKQTSLRVSAEYGNGTYTGAVILEIISANGDHISLYLSDVTGNSLRDAHNTALKDARSRLAVWLMLLNEQDTNLGD